MRLLAVPTFFVFLLSSVIYAQPEMATMWGPETFVREEGKPEYVERLIDTTGFTHPYVLHIRNGQENGENRVSSGRVWFNGQVVLDPSWFNQQVYAYDSQVVIRENSVLGVLVASIPGSGLIVWIEGTPVGKRLEGDPSSMASEAVYDFHVDDPTEGDEISVNEQGTRIDRTNLEIAFSADATASEVNSLLDRYRASIISMLEEVNSLVVKIPDPGTLEDLQTVVSEIESEPIVRYVLTAPMPEPLMLPENFIPSDDLSFIDHNLAVRAHAAWNAKEALKRGEPPVLLIADWFGDGGPNADFAVTPISTSFFKYDPWEHGYHVLGITSATFGGNYFSRGLATGIYPDTLDLRVLDLAGWEINYLQQQNQIVPLLKETALMGRNVVLNTSFGVGQKNSREGIEPYARNWLEKLRGSMYASGKKGWLESSFFHAAAAGNLKIEGNSMDAFLTHGWNAATLLPDLTTKEGVALTPLSNTAVVENRRQDPVDPNLPGCLFEGVASPFPGYAASMVGGNLSAIGVNVWSLTGAELGAKNLTGTSMASPQVAGLAAYVWTLKPNLKPEEVLSLLINTAKVDGCLGAPVIDAYSAVLAVDNPNVLTGGPATDAPARLAVFDLNNDMAFTKDDVESFLEELVVSGDFPPDYSRYDLNGDGYTGGDTTAAFNLDIDYPPTYQEVLNSELNNRRFDENSVSDFDVLCYYAYSPMYEGNTSERDILMAPHLNRCGTLINVGYSTDSMHVSAHAISNMWDTHIVECGISERFGENPRYQIRSEGCLIRRDTYDSGGYTTDTRTTTPITKERYGSFSEGVNASAAAGGVSQSANASLTRSTLRMGKSVNIEGALLGEASGYNPGSSSHGGATFIVPFWAAPGTKYNLEFDCNLTTVRLMKLHFGPVLVYHQNSGGIMMTNTCGKPNIGNLDGSYELKVTVLGSNVDNKQLRMDGEFRLLLEPNP